MTPPTRPSCTFFYGTIQRSRRTPTQVPELANDHIRALLRVRAGLQSAPYGHTPRGFISAAEPLSRWGDTCTRTCCGQPLGTSGLHNLVCLESGQEGMRGMRASRHAPIKYALAAAMRGVGGQRQCPWPSCQ